MPKLGGIYVSVSAKTNKFARDLKKAKGMAAKTAVVMQKQFDSISFKQAGIAALAFSAVVVFGMKKAVDAASDLEETVGKFDVVFADHAQQAEDMADILVESYAMSTREAKQYLSSVQDLLVPMGMVSDQAIVMANEVVKLAADLGSFNNLPTATVMLDIQSALVGNFETMKKYGVVLNETVIKQEALNQGLWDGKGMVNANVKAFIAFNLMLKGSAAAIGDQQRTMGSYANQMKQLKANIEDIAATIGNKLLPQMTEWINQVNVAIKQNPEIIDQIGEFSKNLLDLADTMGRVILFGVEFYNVFVATAQALGLASTGVVSWTEALFNGVEVVKMFNAEQDGLNFRIDKNTEGFEAYAKAIEKVNDVILEKPAPSVGGGSIAKKAKGVDLSGLFEPIIKDEFERDEEMFRLLEEQEEKRLEIVKSFNEEYAELGLNRFELERLQLDREVEIYRDAGVEKNKIDKMVAQKSAEIAKAEQSAKLDIYRNSAGSISDTFQAIAQAGGKQSKEAFIAYKAFAIAEATISGHQAILKALGAAPPPYSFVLAGIAGAATAVQIGMIASASPPSYDVGGVSNARGVYQTGNIREAHVPIPSGKIPVELNGGEGQKPPEVNIFNTIDPAINDQWAASSRGQNAIFNAIGTQPQRLRAMIR